MKQLEEQILSILQNNSRSYTGRQLSSTLGVTRKQRGLFFKTLDRLEEQGTIQKKAGKYGSGNKNTIAAEIVKVNETFGFATPTEDEGGDVFIPGRFFMGALPGDQVLLEVSPSKTGDSREGKVVEITKEENRLFAATIGENDKGRWLIRPDRYVKFDFNIDKKSQITAKPGDTVLAQVSRRGRSHFDHRAEVIERFGDGEKASNAAQAILAEQGIITEFPPAVLEQAKRISDGGIHPKEVAIRKDLRDQLIFTIDGADTKDIDDAISLEKHGQGWTLGVHIADVSYYVVPNEVIDEEAYRRGTSVYYANQVIPMLPPALSNGICSLNPQEDRLAFSALLEIDQDGSLVDYRFEKTIINSALQGVYAEINDLLEDSASAGVREKYADVLPTLRHMEELATLLMNKRFGRGAMHLESVESKIIVGDDGVTSAVEPRTVGRSEGFIEEFMLMANQAAATFGLKENLPFLFRVHDTPDSERVDALFALLDTLGVSYQRPKGDTVRGNALNAILDTVKGTDLSLIINNLMLRTMAKAQYSAENIGHFGLALKNYSHFTSPIRRYPDLAIHRIMTSMLIGMRRDNIESRFRSWVSVTAKHSSMREVAAQSAERDAEDCYKAEYMSRFIGQEFDGTISSATSFGAFIVLPNTIEGLVMLNDFPAGHWVFDGQIAFNNATTNKTLRVGDAVKVQLVKTAVSTGQVDFIFVE